MRYIVRCRVSGGVTGTRYGTLKSKGEVQYFDTKEAAAEEANKQQNSFGNDPYRKADFAYWAESEFAV